MKKELAEKIGKLIEAECECKLPIPGSVDLVIGQAVFIQAVPLYYTGRVVRVDDRYIVLDQAAWIADTGRFHKAMAEGREALVEVEPLPKDRIVRISHGSVLSVMDWPHSLPEATK